MNSDKGTTTESLFKFLTFFIISVGVSQLSSFKRKELNSIKSDVFFNKVITSFNSSCEFKNMKRIGKR